MPKDCQIYRVDAGRYRRRSENRLPPVRLQQRMREPFIRFEEIGYNFGFQLADPRKTEGYFYVYRCLKEKLELNGPAVNIRATDDEIRLTEMEGDIQDRERIRIFNNDITGYYKFDHHAKFVVIRIEACRMDRTGFWFLCFDRTGQLDAFCDFLNWIFNLEANEQMRGGENDSISYFSRHSNDFYSRNSRSTLLHGMPYSESMASSNGSEYADSEFGSRDLPSVREADNRRRQEWNRRIFNQLIRGRGGQR